MVATRDVGRFAAEQVLEPPAASEVIDILGPPVSPRQAAEALGAALGRAVEPVLVPPEAHVGALIGAGLSPSFADAVAELYVAIGAGWVRPCGDRKLVGQTGLAEVLAAALS
jgi:uncharacterized protein YbjT (DUF2867 family)